MPHRWDPAFIFLLATCLKRSLGIKKDILFQLILLAKFQGMNDISQLQLTYLMNIESSMVLFLVTCVNDQMGFLQSLYFEYQLETAAATSRNIRVLLTCRLSERDRENGFI